MSEPILVTRRADLLPLLAESRRRGERLALVPTMGYLHAGHVSLIREAARRADRVAVTIFVNPTQFGPTEDLDRYPRDLAGDLAKCGEAGAWLVYAPADPAEVYPPGFQTWVEVTEISRGLCGARRPGHFRGVATVVSKLFLLFRPDLAFFGEKDFQQLAVLRRMVRDLDLDPYLELVGMPIVREPDGLALSSRNAYLSPDERKRALCLSRALAAAEAAYGRGERSATALLALARQELGEADRIDYVELVDAETLAPIERIERPACLLLAAYLGKTRLIDNRVLGRRA
jgi:pantoate--beta-alanine ligase